MVSKLNLIIRDTQNRDEWFRLPYSEVTAPVCSIDRRRRWIQSWQNEVKGIDLASVVGSASYPFLLKSTPRKLQPYLLIGRKFRFELQLSSDDWFLFTGVVDSCGWDDRGLLFVNLRTITI